MKDLLKEGLNDKAPITQEELRGEVEKSQAPTKPEETVKSDRGSFTLQ